MLDQGVLIIPTMLLAVGIVVHGFWRGLAAWTVTLQMVALVHFAAVVAVAFFPFPYQAELLQSHEADFGLQTNLLPVWSLIEAIATGANPSVVHQSVGNALMLMPLGVYLPLLLPRARRVGTTVSIGLGLSVAIELAQFAISALLRFPYKTADVDDVILNTAGVAFGYGIYWVASRWLPPLVVTPAQSRR